MSEWQPIETAPRDGTLIWVAYHGHGESKVLIASWDPHSRHGRHDNWEYINSHDGAPQFWMPYVEPVPPPGMEGPHCNCDGCMEDKALAAGPFVCTDCKKVTPPPSDMYGKCLECFNKSWGKPTPDADGARHEG